MARNTRPLFELVNEYIATRTEEDFDKYISREVADYYAKTGYRDMAHSIGGTPKSILITPNAVNFVPWPSDYLTYTKIGYLDANNVIRTLTRNDKINFRNEFFTSGSLIVYDSDNVELVATTSSGKSQLNATTTASTSSSDVYWNLQDGTRTLGHRLGYAGGANRKGYYRTNQYGIELSSDVTGDIILEYIGDETMRANPVIPMAIEEAIKTWIYYQFVASKANVPEREKERAKRTHYNMRRVAKRKMRQFILEELVTQGRIASSKLSAKG